MWPRGLAKGRLAYGGFPEQPVAASGAWTGDDTYTAKVCFYETPFLVTFRLKFDGDKAPLRFRVERRVRADQAADAGGTVRVKKA